ncbi:uncharacterized protein LOC112271703 [Brachypodium distachyon]|uniref:uncharacterized protein LOC112271703 n=1 Tax=Brachypodium distachyon TaxID=15368 RepID=UPI000D0DE765|nr:uncharacterized protein LOC112271703 [Brachypodium distachyon]|eukprot:XP_024317240.1 uncharacterized protein LOC112271703 [Brachypodium distachyon]
MVPVRQDPKLGRLLRVDDRYSHLATPSMLAVGSKLRDSCGKANAGTAVLGLAVPVVPVPKIPRSSSGCKRKAPPTPSPSLDYGPADSADPVVGESRSPLRMTLDLHMKGKIGLEQVLPPSSHEVEAFTCETGLRLRSDSVVELSTGASGAGVQVFSIGRERPEENAPTSGARAAEPGVLEGEPPTQARDGVLPSTVDGPRDPFVTLELVRGLVKAVGALPALKTQKTIPLPPLREPLENIVTYASLGPSPAHPDFAVVVAISRESEEDGSLDRWLLHCRPGDPEWSDLASQSPMPSLTSRLISYGGQVYWFGDSNTLAVIGPDDEVLRARLIHTVVPRGKRKHDMPTGYCLVESCGDLFVVPIEQFRMFENDGTPSAIAVFRLDLESREWSSVDSIGDDRAFLVSGRHGFSVPVAQAGGSFVQQEDPPRAYRALEQSILGSPASVAGGGRNLRLLPTNHIAPKEVCESSFQSVEDEEQAAATSGTPPWEDLPIELLELVVSKLSLVDRIRFPAVCKTWSMVSSPFEEAKVWPWLMHCSGREMVEAPIFERKYHYKGLWWSNADPTSPDCVFFGINSNHDGNRVGVYTWQDSEDEWTEKHALEYQEPLFPVAFNNPVLFHDKFYCLGRKGNLGTLDPTNNAWTILEKPEPRGQRVLLPC